MEINVKFEISIDAMNGKALKYDCDELTTKIIQELHCVFEIIQELDCVFFDGVDDSIATTCLVNEVEIRETDN